MAHAIPARLSPAEGRRFGLTVGAAFLLLAALAGWRDRENVGFLLGLVGTLLVLGGLVAPAWMGPVHARWMALARVLSRVTTPVVLGVMYLLVFSVIGFLRRIGGNPLVHEERQGGFWIARPEGARRSGSLRRQF
jgi:hypothetical protein